MPIGEYQAAFQGVDENESDYGKNYQWRFLITEGTQKGKEISRFTTLVPTVKNSCGRMLSGVCGIDLREGEEADPNKHIGEIYRIIVVNARDGGTRVDACMQITS